MSRSKKKGADVSDHDNGQATALAEAVPVAIIPADQPLPSAVPVVAEEHPPHPVNRVANTNGDKRKPEVSWRCPVDKSTSIEVSVWSTEMSGTDGATWTQRNITVVRSYRDQQNVWCKGGSFRAHEIPVLVWLLQRAHAHCLDARTTDSSLPF